MSKYTTEVRFICENYAGLVESVGYESIGLVLDRSRDKVFDFDFPIFDESYRNVLEDKILKHYYTREIGAESVGLWKMWLNTRLNEIMPYYNKMYESELIKFNPMYDVDLTTEHQKIDDRHDAIDESALVVGNRDSNVVGDEQNHREDVTKDGTKNDHWDMYSDTPSGALDGVRDEKYLTSAQHSTDDKTGSVVNSDSDGTAHTEGVTNVDYDEDVTKHKFADIKNIQDYAQHVVGKTGGESYSKLLMEFRSTFLNIDMLIIEDLQDLFMTLW